MKILISEIPSEGLQLHLKGEGRFDIDKKTFPYEADLKIIKEGNDVIIYGQIIGNIELQCSRCLAPFKFIINTPVNITFKPIATIADDGCYEIQRDELDISFYRDNILDIDDIINEQLALNIPMKPLCDLNCNGLCIQCGIDLNKSECSCEKNTIDERFKVLQKLINKKE